MQLISSAFKEGESIPSKYTCDGENISPALQFLEISVDAKSLVLIMDDPDIPEFVKTKNNIEVWDHWVVFNISPDAGYITEGTNPPGELGKNTSGRLAYGGPCPPDREHRYFFKLFALDVQLAIPAGATKAEVEKAMEGHVLESAQLMGKYARH